MTKEQISIPEIIRELKVYDSTYKRQYVDAALAQQEEITPYLIELLAEVLADLETYIDDYDSMGHIYALMLLGHFREPKAHQVIVDLASLPDELPFELFGDTVTEDLASILYKTCDGQIEQIKTLVANIQANPYCRSAAARALVFAVAEGVVPRAEIVNFFGPVFIDEMTIPDSEFIELLADSILDLNPLELLEPIRIAYQANLIDPFLQGDFSNYEEATKKPVEQCLQEQRAELERRSPTDFHKSMEWWACFRQSAPPKPKITPLKPASQNKKKTKTKTRRRRRRRKK